MALQKLDILWLPFVKADQQSDAFYFFKTILITKTNVGRLGSFGGASFGVNKHTAKRIPHKYTD